MKRKSGSLPLKSHYPPGVPRENLAKDSPEWCYMTVDYAKILYSSYKTSLDQWDKVLDEMESGRVYERIPEGHPYGSLESLLKVEFGVSKEESRRTVQDKADEATTNPVLNGEELKECRAAGGKLGGRGKINLLNIIKKVPGVDDGPSTSYLSRRIAAERPDILARMKGGEFTSVRAAALEAGIVDPTFSCPKDPVKAARRILRHFTGDRLTQLIEELSKPIDSG